MITRVHPQSPSARVRTGLVFLIVIMSFIQPSIAAELTLSLDIVFKAEFDNTDQHYIERLPVDFEASKQNDVLIVLHGHGADRSQGVSDFAEFKAAQDVAALHRMIYVSPDYRAPDSWMGPAAEADLVQIISELKTKYKIGRVFLTGASMGGTSALSFAALHPDLVDAACSQNGTANLFEFSTNVSGIQDAIIRSFGGTKAQVPLEYKNRSAAYWPERLTMPVAIQASGKDEMVPPDSVVRLARVLQTMDRRVQLTFRPDRGHDTAYEDVKGGLEWLIKAVGGMDHQYEPAPAH